MIRKSICSLFVALFCVFSLLESCKKKDPSEPSSEEKAYNADLKSNFYKNGCPVIVRHESTKYDLVADLFLPEIGKTPLARLTFFNYGGNIRLFQGCADNGFVYGIGTVKVAYPISSKEEISMRQVQENVTYGSWAYASANLGNFTVDNVFVTPLAYKAYEDGNVDDLMLVVLESSKRYLVAIFNAEPTVHLLAHHNVNAIYPDSDVINIEVVNNPGIFWRLINERTSIN